MNKSWSESKLSEFILGEPKPKIFGVNEYQEWCQDLKNRKRIRFYFSEDFLDDLQDFIYYPFSLILKIKHYILNRFIYKTHTLSSSLKKGEYHSFEDKVLYCLFDSLVDYVEKVKAYNYLVCMSDEEFKNSKITWFDKFKVKYLNCGSQNIGLSCLNWEIGLKHDESSFLDKNDPIYGEQTEQAKTAEIILGLYNWWKIERKHRKDPFIITSCDDLIKNHGYSEEYKDERFRLYKEIDEIEQKHIDEDSEMLMTLIKIRQDLWD